MAKEQNIKAIIEESGLFDKVFYLKEYKDLRRASIKAIEHYCSVGIHEDRKPNKDFDPVWYREFYADINESGILPFVHYILYGQEENRFTNANQLIIIKETTEATEAPDTLSVANLETQIIEVLQIENKKISKKSTKKVSISQKSLETLFDSAYYVATYPDMAESKIEPLTHYLKFGWEEGRKPNVWFDTAFYLEEYKDVKKSGLNPLEHYLKVGMKQDRKTFKKFDFDFYCSYYEDLKGIFSSYHEAIHHYLKYGIKENRLTNMMSLLESRGLSDLEIEKIEKYLKIDFFKTVQNVNKMEVSFATFVENITGVIFKPIKVDEKAEVNSNFYLMLAEIYLLKNNIHVADKYLNISLFFYKSHQALEYKGNINLNVQNYISAAEYYENTLNLGKCSEYLYNNLYECYLKLLDYKNAINTFLGAVEKMPLSSHRFIAKLDKEINNYHTTHKYRALNRFLATENRIILIEDMNTITRDIYDFYFTLYNGHERLKNYNSINKNKVLIIGDYHVEQCVRYRIEQKVEQLETQGYDVKAIDWTQIGTYADIIPFYDIVIFYRVPSTVEIIKTIAKVNALNKISIYEIDDLLFEAIYPDSIESYGGSLEIDTYNSLAFGMSKFNSAAKLCDYGIASTLPLKEKLQKIVAKNYSVLHRNGLDSISSFEKPDKSNKQTLDIFYGSGTLAHNEDFIDLVLPALVQLMEEFKNIRVIIVGHLTLPQNVLVAFAKRIVSLPKVKVKAYYNYLKQADINLAVLHRDEITDAKSELKWFEAGCFYIPSVVSGTQNYLDVIHEGEDGFIATTPDEWYEKLRALVVDTELREHIGTNAANRIKEEYSVETLGQELKKNLNTLVESHYTHSNKKRKKIALVNVFFPPQSIGGATRVVADNFDVLIDSYSDEYEVCVFTSEVECLEPYKMSVYNYKGARVYKSNILYREHMDWHAEDKNMYKLFGEFLETEAPDKVHFHCVQRLTASVVEATRDAKIPYIITAHDAWWISDHQFLVDKNDKVYPEGHPDPFYKRVLYDNMTLDMSIERGAYLKGLLKDAQHVLTVSESFAKIYRKNGIPNIQVTKNGISSKIAWLPKETHSTQKVVCAHIGGMNSHKGYDILQEAVLELQPKHLEFLVVDHSKEESYVSHEKWGTVDVKFVGRQKQEEMVGLYGQIDILFAPSIWPESFGLVTREASACGCWIVASNLGGIGEDVVDGKNGFVIDPTQKAIEVTLKSIDVDYKKYKGLAEKGTVSMVEEQIERLKDFLDD